VITLRLTPAQAKILFNTVDGAADAGACVGGNTKQEARALESISHKLLAQHDAWRDTKIQKG
jgi:glycerate-2-kinase